MNPLFVLFFHSENELYSYECCKQVHSIEQYLFREGSIEEVIVNPEHLMDMS